MTSISHVHLCTGCNVRLEDAESLERHLDAPDPCNGRSLGSQFKSSIRSNGMRCAFPRNQYPNRAYSALISGPFAGWSWKPNKQFIERREPERVPLQPAQIEAIEKSKRLRSKMGTVPTTCWPRWADDGQRPWERARPRAKAPDKESAPKATITYLPRYSLQLPCYKAAA